MQILDGSTFPRSKHTEADLAAVQPSEYAPSPAHGSNKSDKQSKDWRLRMQQEPRVPPRLIHGAENSVYIDISGRHSCFIH